MTFQDAIISVINDFGKDILTTESLFNILNDYNAYEESKSFRLILKSLISEGCVGQIPYIEDWETTSLQMMARFVNSTGIQRNKVEYLLNSIAFAVGKTTVRAVYGQSSTSRTEYLNCPHCKGEHSSTALFCENTGKRLKSACTNKSCSEYGKYVLLPNAKFCSICGAPIVDVIEQERQQYRNEIEQLKQKHDLLEKQRQVKCTACEEKYTKEITNLKATISKYEAERKLQEEQRKKEATQKQQKNVINGHDYVDLGLSVKWAACNVGANKPEEYGNYYAWGETSTKSSYNENNSSTYKKNMSDISGNASYDAARANWGGTWRMPTKAEMEELKDKCTWRRVTQSGVDGYKVTGPNGNSIFLPAAGYCDGSSRNYVGVLCHYWSSTPYESTDCRAYGFFFGSAYRCVYWLHRSLGLTVRPVSKLRRSRI